MFVCYVCFSSYHMCIYAECNEYNWIKLKLKQLQWLYDLSDTEYLNYVTVTRCIPTELREKLNHEQMTYTQPTYPISLIDTEQKIRKIVYKTLVKNKMPESPNREMTHWQNTFVDKELQWKQIYTLTIDTKRVLQCKSILKILPADSFLHKYCSVPSSLCGFCFMTRDSLSHMFWKCHII